MPILNYTLSDELAITAIKWCKVEHLNNVFNLGYNADIVNSKDASIQ